MTTTLTEPIHAPKSGKRKWLKRLLWLSLTLLVLVGAYYFLIFYFLVWGGTISPAELAETYTCTQGEYRLLEYKYRDGSGYLELVDRSGKVLNKSKFSNSMVVGRIHWHNNCREVNVGSDEGRVILEVPK